MKNLFFISLLSLSFLAQAQKAPITKQPAGPGAYPDVNLVVYKNAIALHDYGTAIHALHYIIAANPGGAPYTDTLALLYAQTGQYLQAGSLADIQLNTKGYTDLRMEIKAQAAKNLNSPVAAIDCYSTLYDKTKNAAYGFEKLQLEYGIKRLAEAAVTAGQLLSTIPPADSTQLQVMKADNKTAQVVPLRAGILNMQGIIFTELNQKESAVQALQAALKLAPDFEMAKANLKTTEALAEKQSTAAGTK